MSLSRSTIFCCSLATNSDLLLRCVSKWRPNSMTYSGLIWGQDWDKDSYPMGINGLNDGGKVINCERSLSATADPSLTTTISDGIGGFSSDLFDTEVVLGWVWPPMGLMFDEEIKSGVKTESTEDLRRFRSAALGSCDLVSDLVSMDFVNWEPIKRHRTRRQSFHWFAAITALSQRFGNLSINR